MRVEEYDEKRLVRKAASGDKEAFSALLERNEALMYNIALRMMGNSEDACDMVQEAAIKIYRSIGRFEGSSKISTWMHRVTVNTCLDELRRRKLRAFKSFEELEEGGAVLGVSRMESPEEAAEIRSRSEILRGELDALPPEQKAALVLRDIQGFTYEETAKMLACPVGTVKSRVSRARDALKKALARNAELFQGLMRQNT